MLGEEAGLYPVDLETADKDTEGGIRDSAQWDFGRWHRVVNLTNERLEKTSMRVLPTGLGFGREIYSFWI